VIGGAVVVDVPPPPLLLPLGVAVIGALTGEAGVMGVRWRWPNPKSWAKLDRATIPDKWVGAIAIEGRLGDAEASMAIIPTSMQEEMASATTLGKRCAVLPLTN
jgi:hypothetical protein